MESDNFLMKKNNPSKIHDFFKELHAAQNPENIIKKRKEDFFFSFLSTGVDDPNEERRGKK